MATYKRQDFDIVISALGTNKQDVLEILKEMLKLESENFDQILSIPSLKLFKEKFNIFILSLLSQNDEEEIRAVFKEIIGLLESRPSSSVSTYPKFIIELKAYNRLLGAYLRNNNRLQVLSKLLGERNKTRLQSLQFIVQSGHAIKSNQLSDFWIHHLRLSDEPEKIKANLYKTLNDLAKNGLVYKISNGPNSYSWQATWLGKKAVKVIGVAEYRNVVHVNRDRDRKISPRQLVDIIEGLRLDNQLIENGSN